MRLRLRGGRVRRQRRRPRRTAHRSCRRGARHPALCPMNRGKFAPGYLFPAYLSPQLISSPIFKLLTPTLPFRPARQVTAAGSPGLLTRLRFAPTSSVGRDAEPDGSGRHTAPGVGAPTPSLGPCRPKVTSMEGSVAPNQSDHRADADIPASDNQGHDAGCTGVEIEIGGQAEQPHAQPAT